MALSDNVVALIFFGAGLYFVANLFLEAGSKPKPKPLTVYYQQDRQNLDYFSKSPFPSSQWIR